MNGIRSAAVVGLGLIGGSVARELSARGVRVLGYDRNGASLRAAREAGVVHAELGTALEGIEAAEVVVLAVPVEATPGVLAAACPRLDRARLVTDSGSTKRSIVAAAEALGLGDRFVGGHPLAGDHRAGWAASRSGLFTGARVFLCPGRGTRSDALQLAEWFWAEFGAKTELIGAAEHDRQLAWSSHLPQAAASALALALAGAGVEPRELGCGGRDTTRLAGSSAEVWTSIALDNADHLAEAVTVLEGALGDLRVALSAGDAARVHAWFAAGADWCRRGDPSRPSSHP
jgi:prephenate dehydrogenase